MRTTILFIVLAMLYVSVPAGAADDWRSLAPLPDDVAVEPAPGNVTLNPNVVKLLGVWQGEWQAGGLGGAVLVQAGWPTIIVVERIFGNNVQGILSCGTYSMNVKAFYTRVLGAIQKDQIVFEIGPRKVRLTLKLIKDDSALSEWELGGTYLRAHLKRKALMPANPGLPQEATSPPAEKEAPGRSDGNE